MTHSQPPEFTREPVPPRVQFLVCATLKPGLHRLTAVGHGALWALRQACNGPLTYVAPATIPMLQRTGHGPHALYQSPLPETPVPAAMTALDLPVYHAHEPDCRLERAATLMCRLRDACDLRHPNAPRALQEMDLAVCDTLLSALYPTPLKALVYAEALMLVNAHSRDLSHEDLRRYSWSPGVLRLDPGRAKDSDTDTTDSYEDPDPL